MVRSIGRIKSLFVITLFVNVFIASNVCAVSVQGLIQYDETGDRNRLELLEDRQIIHIVSDYDYAYQATGIYVIRNTGDEYKTTLGVLLFAGLDLNPDPRRMDMEFFVDDKQIPYNTITNLHTLTYGKETYDLHGDSVSWALIDVVFPAESTITICVRFKNNFSPQGAMGVGEGVGVSYNSHLYDSFLSRMSYWKGPAKFSLEVLNDYISDNNVEHFWVTDFRFDVIGSIRVSTDTLFLYANEFLFEMKDMEINLMKIDKTTGNSFKIEFKEDFLVQYERNFYITLMRWRDDYDFIHINGDSPGISLEYQKDQYGNPRPRGRGNPNISERALGAYEFIFFTNNQLRVMRNAIYAQYGYIFRSEDLRNMFADSPNSSPDLFPLDYKPNPNFCEGMLTDIDRQNIETIQRLEAMTED